MSKQLEAVIECPFYINYGDKSLTCEGLANGCGTTHTFKNNKEKTEYILSICGKSGGKKCCYHRMLALLYERGGR